MRQVCKIANSEEGIEKLFEHTIQRQNAELAAKVDRLTSMVELMTTGQLTVATPTDQIGQANQVSVQQTVNQVSVHQTVNQVNQVNQVQIALWSNESKLSLSASDVAEAFAGSARIKEYESLGTDQQTNMEIATPYVLDLFMTLTKKAHEDPAARNVCLSSKRADQALVHVSAGVWDAMPLHEATREIFDAVKGRTSQIVTTPTESKQLSPEAQSALAVAGMMYRYEPDEYAKRAKGPMAAHLANMATAMVCSK